MYLATVGTLGAVRAACSLADEARAEAERWGLVNAEFVMLDDAGFAEIEVREVDDDPINNYYVARRGPVTK